MILSYILIHKLSLLKAGEPLYSLLRSSLLTIPSLGGVARRWSLEKLQRRAAPGWVCSCVQNLPEVPLVQGRTPFSSLEVAWRVGAAVPSGDLMS